MTGVFSVKQKLIILLACLGSVRKNFFSTRRNDGHVRNQTAFLPFRLFVQLYYRARNWLVTRVNLILGKVFPLKRETL